MYNFEEAKLGVDFAKEKLKDFKDLIDRSQSFTVVSLPGVGVSYFLKYLVSLDFAHFLYIDLYNLPTLNQHEFYRMFLRDLGGNPDKKSDEQVFIEAKGILKKLSTKHPKIVIVFSRFDSLRKDFDKDFLSHLQSLTTLGKIMLIFTAIKPLDELTPEAVSGGNLAFYSKILYFKPYLASDLKKLFALEHTPKAHLNIDELIAASGGHNQLLHIFLNSHKQQNLLLDKFVKLQLKDLYDYLDYQQKKQVARIASHPERLKGVEGSIDEYLLGVGYITLDKNGPRLFSPLLEQYIKTNLPNKLPPKESRLFKLLRKNIGRVVSKDEIFAEVWGEDTNSATDWALDALIYRLRNSNFIKSQGYIIESQKKIGYSLVST